MPVSDAGHHAMLDHLGSISAYAGLCQATTLAADVLAGATSVDLDHEVAVGDFISLNDPDVARETHEVTAVSGTGPFTATLAEATSNAHGANTYVGHAPVAPGTLREATGSSYARQSITWNAASGLNLDSSNQPQFSVALGNAVGAFLLSDVADPATAVFHGAFLTDGIEVFGADGGYDLTDADVSLEAVLGS